MARRRLHLTRRAALVATFGVLAVAGVAQAASTVYWDGPIGVSGEKWSSLVSLTSSEGLSNDGNLVCIAAVDASFVQVGTVSCTTSSSGIGKPYNGTTRRAWMRPQAGSSVNAKGRAVY